MESVITLVLLSSAFYLIYKTQKIKHTLAPELEQTKLPGREPGDQITPNVDKNLSITQNTASTANNTSSWNITNSTEYADTKNSLIVNVRRDDIVSPLFDPRNFRGGVTPFLNSK